MDRLLDAIDRMRNPSVVGLDPTPLLVPGQIIASFADEAAETAESAEAVPALQLAMAYVAFNRAVIDGVADIVPAVKPQIAMYEALGPVGVDAYARTCAYAQRRGLYVIGDVKRGDIGSTAEAYAHHLSGVPAIRVTAASIAGNAHEAPTDHDVAAAGDPWHEDAITVNPYLGEDGIAPFIRAAANHDKDIFVLVHTSNPSSAQIQELELADGGKVYEHIARLVESWGASTRGAYGYSAVGGVFGATFSAYASSIRSLLPHTMLLVPGYGAQGATADDVAPLFDADRRGAIISSSRAIIGSWRRASRYDSRMTAAEALALVSACARESAIEMRSALRRAIHG